MMTTLAASSSPSWHLMALSSFLTLWILVKCIKGLCHNFRAPLEVHRAFILIMDCIQFCLCNYSHTFAQLALTVVLMISPGFESSLSIFSHIVRLDPCPSGQVNEEHLQLPVNCCIVHLEGITSQQKLKHSCLLSSSKLG